MSHNFVQFVNFVVWPQVRNTIALSYIKIINKHTVPDAFLSQSERKTAWNI